jgi:hypothetical protein
MNRVQKIAWLFVISISIAVLLSGLAIGILYIKYGFPKAASGLNLLGLAGFGGFGLLIFKKDKGAVTCDERDITINRRAALAGFFAAFLTIGLSCMLPYYIYGPDKTISVSWLPMIFEGAGLATFFTHSLAILIQYGREKMDGQ